MTFLVESDGRLDQFLVARTGRTRMFLKEQIEDGRVCLNGREVRKPAARVRAGDRVECRFHEDKPLGLVPVPGELEVLHEDASLVVLNKRQGQVVHPAAGHRGETLVHHLLHRFREDPAFSEQSPDRPGIVHRLDRGTSGVIVIAKNREVQAALSRLFKERLVEKEYEAVAWGRLAARGEWKNVIGRDRSDRKKWSSRTDKGRAARTRWQARRLFGHFTHVALFPHTGRTHQLRVHLTEAGHPIVGDPLYGTASLPRRLKHLPEGLAAEVEALGGTLLHARRLAFRHPVTGEPMAFEAPRPVVFDNFLRALEERDP